MRRAWRIAGLANFSPQVLGFTINIIRVAGFEMFHELRVWPVFVLGFRVFRSNFLFCRVFVVIGLQSMQFIEIEKPALESHALLTKIEDFY